MLRNKLQKIFKYFIKNTTEFNIPYSIAIGNDERFSTLSQFFNIYFWSRKWRIAEKVDALIKSTESNAKVFCYGCSDDEEGGNKWTGELWTAGSRNQEKSELPFDM